MTSATQNAYYQEATMEALAPTTTLSQIAKADDPIAALADLAQIVTVEDDGSILIFGAPLASFDAQQIVRFRAAFAALAARFRAMAGDCETVVAAKMYADGASELFDPEYDVTFKPTKGEDVIYAELLYNALQPLIEAGKCDPEIAGKAVARVETVTYKTHRTYIKQLDKFGGEVAAAVKAAVRPGEDGPPRLVIKEKQ